MAFSMEKVEMKDAIIISGGCNNDSKKGDNGFFIIFKDELISVGEKMYWEIAPTKKRWLFNRTFGIRELMVILDDLKIKRRAATLKLSREHGAGLFHETTQLRAHSAHDRQQAKRCRDMMSTGQCGPTVEISLPAFGADSPAITMHMIADLSLKKNITIEINDVNLTWLCAACLHIRLQEHTNTVVWCEVKHSWNATRLEDTRMHVHAMPQFITYPYMHA